VVSTPDRDQLGYRSAANGDDDLLPGFDAAEEPSGVIAQLPGGHKSHTGSVADS